MARNRKQLDPAEDLVLKEEILDTQLAEDYDSEALRGAFVDYEAAVGAATQARATTLVDGFTRLAERSDRSREVASSIGDIATSGYFIAKHQTYRTFLDTVSEIPVIEPTPTDPDTRDMSGGKG